MAMFSAAAAAAAATALVGAALFPPATAVSAGSSHSCAVLSDATVKCFGDNTLGQLGQLDSLSRGLEATDMGDNLPTVPLGTFEAAAVYSGNEFNCAVSVDGGSVKCWGQNEGGQLGLGDTEARGGLNDEVFEMGENLPTVDFSGNSGLSVESMSLGGSAACVVLTGGSVRCWGANEAGQLGLGDTENRGDEPDEMGDDLPFVDLGTGAVVSSVAVGAKHACATMEDGVVKCWGNNDGGQLGYEDRFPRGTGVETDGVGAMGDALAEVDLGLGQRAIAVEAGFFHTCALLYEGDVKCWGFGSSGQLGQGSNASIGDALNTMGDNLAPVDLGTGRTAVAVALGGTHTCAVLDDETLKCWGGNSLGSLGLGDAIPRGTGPGEMGDNLESVPLMFGDGEGAASNVFAGSFHSCVTGSEGGLACFGYNILGQLGAGTNETMGDEPGEVEALTSVDFGEEVTVVAPVSPWSIFNASLTVSSPGTQIGNVDGGDGDDGVSSSTIAAAIGGGVAAVLLVSLAVCCCCCRRRLRQREKQREQLRQRESTTAAAAAASAAAEADSAAKATKVDNGKRVQFNSNVNPEVIDTHPLLRGVCLDPKPPTQQSASGGDPATASAGGVATTPGAVSAAAAAVAAAEAPPSSTSSEDETKVSIGGPGDPLPDGGAPAAPTVEGVGQAVEPLPRPGANAPSGAT